MNAPKPAGPPASSRATGTTSARTAPTSPASATPPPAKEAQPSPVRQVPATQPPPASRKADEAANQLLSRAEQDIASAIDSLNNQMNTALVALAELAAAHAEKGKAVVRTAPLDRATATFQRLVAEVVDDQLAEMLPPLIALRGEMSQWAAGGQNGSPEADFHRRGLETLDHVLSLAGATSFDARPGQGFDPLIHLAVGEVHRDDLPAGAVAECIQPGFRSARGKVLTPARVRINRR